MGRIAHLVEDCFRGGGASISACLPDDLELLRVVFVEKTDRDTHDAVVITGYRVGSRYFDSVVVFKAFVCRFSLNLLIESSILRHRHEVQGLVATAMVQVGEPSDSLNPYEFCSVLVHPPSCGIKRVTVRNLK